ncbi:MAG: hypothetical protein UW71_C0027G0007 [Parcubacteria group bacterium GW2011_GWB1_44_7]|nr:MAG: hypothetical protein UW71_C0027G0007 [Parcubacteria group bacterium GW2011_GWB1_44_7]
MSKTLETIEQPPVELANRYKGVTPHGTEICISCGKDTGVSVDREISFRAGYIEGCGQLCEGCAQKFS